MTLFLGLKIVKNRILREWWIYFCLRFRRHFFRRTKLGDWWDFQKIVFYLNFGLKGVIEKCVGCFVVYLFWGFYFLIKRYNGSGGLNFCVKLIRRLAAKKWRNEDAFWDIFDGILYNNDGYFSRKDCTDINMTCNKSRIYSAVNGKKWHFITFWLA